MQYKEKYREKPPAGENGNAYRVCVSWIARDKRYQAQVSRVTIEGQSILMDLYGSTRAAYLTAPGECGRFSASKLDALFSTCDATGGAFDQLRELF
jgi:hypothetical protein